MRLFIFTAFIFFLCDKGYSQNKSHVEISGSIIDSSTALPIEYATIVFVNKALGKVINGAVTDSIGKFKMSDIVPGLYSLTADFIGYKKKTIDVQVEVGKQSLLLSAIKLIPAQELLEGVTVTGSLPVFENKIDKMIYNAANDVTAQGGIALDILRKVPQVTVDIDGNIELQGNSNIRFLINGKPSSIFGNSITDALSSIPASQIKSIEVITSPGAKYDAQGTAGIINIILKENKVQGFNGSINLSGGTLMENGSVNLNFRHNTWGVNTYFNGNARLTRRTYTYQDRTSSDTANRTTHLIQDGFTDFDRNGYQSGIGFDWTITPKDNITASLGYNHFENHGSGSTAVTEYGASATNIDRIANNHSSMNAIDWSLNYKRSFAKKEQELNFLITSSYGLPVTEFSQTQSYSGQITPFLGSSSSNPGKDNATNVSLDYAQPLMKDVILETGIKTVQETINSNSMVNILDPISESYSFNAAQSYQLNYSRSIYAGYLSGSFSALHFVNIKTGLRYEYTDTRLNSPGIAIPMYNTLVPSIILSHSFNDQTIKISYTRRIERPDYREINSFLNMSDPYNITTGNPLLKPEIGDNIELSYFTTIGKEGNLYIALFDRMNNQDIKPYTAFYSDYKVGDSVYSNVSINSRINIGSEQNFGITTSGSVQLLKHFKLRANITVANRHIVNNVDGGIINSPGVRANLNMNYQLPKNLIVELFGDYRSPFINIQGKQPQSLTYTFAFRKDLLHKKLSIGLTATNLFNGYIRELTTITTTNYTSYTIRKVPYRSIGISMSYKFGKLEFKKVKEENFQNSAPVE